MDTAVSPDIKMDQTEDSFKIAYGDMVSTCHIIIIKLRFVSIKNDFQIFETNSNGSNLFNSFTTIYRKFCTCLFHVIVNHLPHIDASDTSAADSF